MAKSQRCTRGPFSTSYFVAYLLLLLFTGQQVAGAGVTVLSRTRAYTYDVTANKWSTTAEDLSIIAPFEDDPEELADMACAVLQTPHSPEDSPYAICDYEETCNATEGQRLIQYDVLSGRWERVTRSQQELARKLPPARGAQLIRVRSNPGVVIDVLFASACGGDVYMSSNFQSASTSAPPTVWERYSLDNIGDIECIASWENGYFVVIERLKFTLFKAEMSTTTGDIAIRRIRTYKNFHALISEGRGCATATAPDGTIFVSGGTSETGKRRSWSSSSANHFQRVTRTEILASSMSATVEVLEEQQLPFGRRDHAMLYQNGYLYVFGGVGVS
jgi:hypothetical protein